MRATGYPVDGGIEAMRAEVQMRKEKHEAEKREQAALCQQAEALLDEIEGKGV